MADAMGDAAGPTLNLTPEEKRVFGQLFRQADSDNIGVVTGEVAVKFFEKTGLEPRILGEIWQIADSENRGLLTPSGFGIVLRLIGHYQAGREPTRELAFSPGPLPKFDGIVPGGAAPPALQPQASGSAPIRVPPLTPDKVAQYSSLFEKSGAHNGLLPGEQAKQIFEKSGLSNDILVRIWILADTEQRGVLSSAEFVVAMHLIASFKTGALRALPSSLPAGLYEAANRKPPSRQMSGASAQMGPIPRQYSGARTSSPMSQSPYGGPIQPQYSGQRPAQSDWLITPADKARFDSIFVGLDRSNKGFITGDEAVPFFSESKLAEDVLAQIWDLADVNSEGRLSRDEFAVAMYLIRQQRSKRDPLPAALPPMLIPPSLRNQNRPAPPQTASAFDSPPPPQKAPSAADDLFGLDAFSATTAISPPLAPAVPAPAQVPLSTGGSNGFGSDPFNSTRQMTPTSPIHASPAPIAPSTTFKPFIPSSSFGQTLTQQPTGGSNSPQPQTTAKSAAMDDLLGPSDPEESKKLTNETTELANLSNQVGTLSKQMQEVQGQRTTTQQELTQQTSQKREFETRLSQLRTLYEQEVRDVRSLEERLTASRNETKKLQTEFAMLEGTYQDLQTQHRNTATALQADQQENASLKERIRVMNAEIAQLKPQLEKLRSEARQQKGLVAINKKQLATNEAERDKNKADIADLTKSNEETARALANSPPVSTPPVASPAPSITNPFFRRQGSTSEVATSPFSGSAASFENVFGPAFGAAAATAEVPAHETEAKEALASPPAMEAFPSPPATVKDVAHPESSEQPPSPPESRQMNSSFLPLPMERADSMSSSRQVSAPASRYEGSVGGDTPTNAIATPTGSSVGPVEPRGGSPVLARNFTGSSIGSGPTSKETAMPGSFPTDVKPASTADSMSDEKPDPFGSKEVSHPKDDFDAAFAGFGTTTKAEPQHTGSNHGSSGFNSEFPPIAELEQDESDSASEAGNGFDDDFTSAAEHAHRDPEPETIPPAASLAPEKLATDPPTPNAQQPPPAYDQTVTTGEQAHAEVQQYNGLLPTREEPKTSPPPPQPSFASSGSGSFFNANSAAPSASGTKNSFDDFDNDFDGLEDAKEADGDDDFTHISVHDRSGLDDFNPVFDSPAASKDSVHTAQDSSAFSFTQSPAPTNNPPPTGAPVDSHDWDAIFAGLDSPSGQTPTLDVPASVPKPTDGADRPQIGRALTETGEHDDPILKSLTNMGYARADALGALEKYDYNLERAANFLANSS